MNKQLEKEIEDKIVEYAFTKGIVAIKFKNPGNTGAPDRICLQEGARVFFIEFKKPGEVPTLKQKIYHDDLRKLGFNVYVCDSFDSAVNAIAGELMRNRGKNHECNADEYPERI